jgi:hypothetical protein
MTIESGALEQSYAKVETSYAVTPADALGAGDALNHLDLSVESKKNREASPEKRGTPDEAQSLPRRQTQNFNLASIMWEPSGTLGTISNVGKFLKAGMGGQATLTLDTTVATSPAASATGATLINVTGLGVGSLIAFTVGAVKQITKITTISIAEPTIMPIALAAALAGAPGNVDDGLHNYRVVHVRPLGDTQAGAVTPITVVNKLADGQVSLTGIAAGPAGTTARKVYRTKVGAPLAYFLLTTIADNVTTIFTDNVADAGLGAALVEPAVTFDALSAAPTAPGSAISGITYTLANNVTESFAVYKYYNGGGFKQAVYGAVVDKIEAMFDGTREVLLAIQGPAGDYADSTYGTVQAKPALHTTVGAPASGMIGTFYVGPDAFLVISAKVSMDNLIELRNKELGTSKATGIAGRNNLRKVKVTLTCYLEDLRILTMANAVTVGELRLLIGQTKGSMLACILPKVEFEIPSVGNEIGPKEITFEGTGYATDGNDQVFFGEL